MNATEPHAPVVLMVDDDQELLEEYQELLECDGVDALICNDPLRAIEMVCENRSIEVVLTDLFMDGMDGLTMINRMQETLTDRSLHFALITGASEVQPDLPGSNVCILYKPVDPDQLISTITGFLG